MRAVGGAVDETPAQMESRTAARQRRRRRGQKSRRGRG
uniref:Uncharacterized protein n=1 Tax=Arundo donax TaxID=35708 RepID=A0A0A9C425_ARUDO